MAAADLHCVAPSDVARIWPHVLAPISLALHRGGSDYDTAEIYRRLVNDEALLWLTAGPSSSVASDIKLYGVLVTEVGILKGTNRKICTIVAFWSSAFKRTVQYFEDIHNYARNEGCERMRLYGRSGWERALRRYGYRPLFALEKVL